mmetsp:Transcript_19883/g.63799  ORF Transcript_19883/g.63799 Transcript_19883/m.63799 type:complete len:219 (-) Transcript_19883:604-1260(-)
MADEADGRLFEDWDFLLRVRLAGGMVSSSIIGSATRSSTDPSLAMSSDVFLVLRLDLRGASWQGPSCDLTRAFDRVFLSLLEVDVDADVLSSVAEVADLPLRSFSLGFLSRDLEDDGAADWDDDDDDDDCLSLDLRSDREEALERFPLELPVIDRRRRSARLSFSSDEAARPGRSLRRFATVPSSTGSSSSTSSSSFPASSSSSIVLASPRAVSWQSY